jgi:DNA-directed RNA polymerase subunit RPC12/RpoP
MSYSCEFCGTKFSSSNGLSYHKEKLVCLKEKKLYKCLICEKEFDHKGNFETHSQTKTCNSELIKNLKDQINNQQILISQLKFEKSTINTNYESLEEQHQLLTSKYKKLETLFNNQKDSNDSLVDVFENATLEKLSITEDLLFNNNKLTFKLFSLIRQIILNHHNNKYFDIIKKIIFKLKTFNNIHKDINEHFHIIFNSPESNTDDLKTTFKYFKPLLKDQKYFDNYFKINFKIDSDNFDFSSV